MALQAQISAHRFTHGLPNWTLIKPDSRGPDEDAERRNCVDLAAMNGAGEAAADLSGTRDCHLRSVKPRGHLFATAHCRPRSLRTPEKRSEYNPHNSADHVWKMAVFEDRLSNSDAKCQ